MGTAWRVSPLPRITRLLKGRDFRFDEVSIIRGNDIFFDEDFMIINVLKSGNDQLRKGDQSKSFFRNFLALFVLSSFLSGTLLIFPSPLAPGISFLVPCLTRTTPLSYFPRTSLSAVPQLQRLFARTWEESGFTLTILVFYSLRSKGATSAAYNGVSDRVFQRLGRCKSV